MPTIKRTARADEDLIDIWLFIAHDDVRAADRVLDDIEEKLLLLADQPDLGPARPDIAPDLRYFPVRRYLILYRQITDCIEIVRVVHGARDVPTLMADPLSHQPPPAPTAPNHAAVSAAAARRRRTPESGSPRPRLRARPAAGCPAGGRAKLGSVRPDSQSTTISL
jgi:toxin ParE1/3/4